MIARLYPQHAILILLSLPEKAFLFFSTQLVPTYGSQTISHIFHKTFYDPPFHIRETLTHLCLQSTILEF